MKPFPNAVVYRKLQAWTKYLIEGTVQIHHVWDTICTWHSLGLLTDAQYNYLMKNLP